MHIFPLSITNVYDDRRDTLLIAEEFDTLFNQCERLKKEVLVLQKELIKRPASAHPLQKPKRCNAELKVKEEIQHLVIMVLVVTEAK